MPLTKTEQKKYLQLWKQYRDNSFRNTPIDLNETELEKKRRVEKLEKTPEQWFAYYFPEFYTAEPAPFHKKATKRVLKNPEYYEVRSWSRELAKSTRTMMEVLYLTLTGKKKNVLMVSDTLSNAERLLLPYKSILEVNQRIINDYGKQQSIGNWESHEFVTTKGVSFRALGAGQSPRGTKKDAVRPDTLLIDDIDTDEEVRNPDRVTEKVNWINKALIPTRSISEPLLIIANGNIIAKYCVITELGKMADTWDIVNIRDENGNSTWPQKNTEELIDRALSKIPWSAQQQEYYNNPVQTGDTFKEIYYDKLPPLRRCEQVIVYADPATSNKDRATKTKQASYKSVVIVGSSGQKRYLYKVWLDQVKNATFIDWLFEAHLYLIENKVDIHKIYIENNSLQDPFYQQVLLPLIKERGKTFGISLPITEDKRAKKDKFFRIEATLEPLNRLGHLIFNIKEKNNPHMVRMHDQMLGVSPTQKIMDGPDALEGAVWLINHRNYQRNTSYRSQRRPSRKY